MKIFLSVITLLTVTACSQQAVYNILHERERQICLEQGGKDCSRAESYDKYKQQRDEMRYSK